MINFIANYEVVGTNSATIQDLKKWLLKHKVRALDSETAMSEWVEEQTPISYQIGDKHTQWVIDCRDVSIESLKSLLQSEKAIHIIHNAKFDYKILKYHSNIILESVWDTMLAEQILNTGLDKPKGYYTLEQTHERYFSTNPYGNQLSLFDPWIPKKTRTEISKKTTEPLSLGDIFYGAMDIITAFKVYEVQKKIIKEQELDSTVKLENEFVLVLGDMELNGMPINSERWLELAEWSANKMQDQLRLLQALYPTISNWNSHVQVKKLFKELGIPIKYQQKESIAELVIKEYKDQYPIIGEFLKYKKYQKLNSTYGVKFLDHMNPHTGRIHSSYLQIMSTGRTSSTSPNLQNIPTAKGDFLEGAWWKEAFQTKSQYGFTIADYSSQEMRLAAFLAKDQELIKIFKEHRDPHTEAASALYNVPIESVEAHQRKNAKTFNFAVLYGTGAYKLSKTFGVSIKEAERLITNYFTKFKDLRAFQDNSYNNALQHGYIEADVIGRRSYISEHSHLPYLQKLAEHDPEIAKEYKQKLGEIFRDSCNYPIQGTAALIAKQAGILMRAYLKLTPNAFKIVLLEHDCWITENLSPSACHVVEDCMRLAAEQYCSIEIPAEGLVTNKWSK